jgi:hypothetical protein
LKDSLGVVAIEYMKLKPTISDVLEAISTFAENVDERFNKIDERFDRIEGRVSVDEGKLARIESQMVTKSYLDDKLADLKGDLIGTLRKKDERVTKLVKTLSDKKVISKSETFEIMQLKPFP